MPTHHIPEGFRAVTPYLIVSDADKLIAFLREVFEAEEIILMRSPEGEVQHAAFRIADSNIELGQAGAEWTPSPAALHVYVPDADAVYEKAIKAGATSLYPPTDMFYGERSGGVKDAVGNQWFIATFKEKLSIEEMKRRAAESHKSK